MDEIMCILKAIDLLANIDLEQVLDNEPDTELKIIIALCREYRRKAGPIWNIVHVEP